MNDPEEAVRRLFGVATEDVPPGIDLLQGMRTKSHKRAARIRALAAAGLAGIAATAAAITLTVNQAPSALAQVIQAASRTAAQSYRVTGSYVTVCESGTGAGLRSPGCVAARLAGTRATLSGEFDPARGTGEWHMPFAPGPSLPVRYVGRYLYVPLTRALRNMPDPAWFPASIPAGKSWLRVPAPRLNPGLGVLKDALLSPNPTVITLFTPQNLLADLELVSQVREAGPAAGPGWTGTTYTFITRWPGARQQPALSGSVEVDRQGRVRRLDVTAGGKSVTVRGKVISGPKRRVELTFADFGVAVPVSAPPAGETFISPNGGLDFVW